MRSAPFLLGLMVTMGASAAVRAQQPAPYPTLPPAQDQAPPPPPSAPPEPPPLGAPSAPPLVAPLRPVPRGAFGAAHADAVRFEPTEPGIALLTRSGTERVLLEQRFRRARYYSVVREATYSPMCEGPCSLTLAPGAYDFALSKDGGRAVRPDEPVVLQGPSELRGEYTDRSGLRVAGTVIGIAGLIGGIVMIVAAAEDTGQQCDSNGFCSQTGHVDGGLVLGGVATIVGSLIVGTVLGLQRDSARIFVSPLSLNPPREYGSNLPAEGAMMGLRF